MTEDGKAVVFEVVHTPCEIMNGERYLSNQKSVVILAFASEEAVRVVKSYYKKHGCIINEIIIRKEVDIIGPLVTNRICRKNMKAYLQENNMKSGDFGVPERSVWMNSSSI
jgi:hypothetical protein